MTRVAHIINANTPADMRWQLLALRSADEPVFSIGPAPQHEPKFDTQVVHRSVGPVFINANRLAGQLPMGATLHVWSPDCLAIATAAARKIGGKVVLSIPHLPDSQAELQDLPWMIGQHQCTLTVPTENARKTLLSLGADPLRTVMLSPAADFLTDADDIQTRRKNLRAELGVGDEEWLMVVPGDMVRYGGHELASWSHAILRNMHKPMKMIFPGHGPFEKSIRFFANTTGFVHEVFFTGDRFARADVLAAADGAMFINKRDRGVTALAQTMAAGLGILASATKDISEICTHEETALLVEVGNPRTASAILLQLLDDRNLAETLGCNAKQVAQANFSPAKIRTKLDEIYTAAKPI